MHEFVAKVGQTKRRKRVKQSSQLQRSTSRKSTEHFIFDFCDFPTKKNMLIQTGQITTGFTNRG